MRDVAHGLAHVGVRGGRRRDIAWSTRQEGMRECNIVARTRRTNEIYNTLPSPSGSPLPQTMTLTELVGRTKPGMAGDGVAVSLQTPQNRHWAEGCWASKSARLSDPLGGFIPADHAKVV
jgi:hypothetical protein